MLSKSWLQSNILSSLFRFSIQTHRQTNFLVLLFNTFTVTYSHVLLLWIIQYKNHTILTATWIIQYSLPRESYDTKIFELLLSRFILKCEECLIDFLNAKNAFSIWVVCFFIILDRKRKDIIFCPFSVSRLIGLSCLQSSSAETPTTHIGTSYQKQNNKNINLHKTAAVNFI